MIDLDVSAAKIAEANILLSHVKNGAPIAINAALNRTIDGVRTDATRAVTATYDIKSKDVRDAMKIKKSTVSTLEAGVSATGGPIPLMKFKVKPGNPETGMPLRASTKRSSGKDIPSAFVTTMRNGHTGVFRRVGDSRYPIKELYGPSVAQMLGEQNVQQGITDKASERFVERLDHEIGRVMDKG